MIADKKKILIDLSKLKSEYCGLWEVAHQLGQALINRFDFEKWKVTFLVPKNHPFTNKNVRYKRVYWWHRFLLRLWHYDILHGLAQNSPYLRRKNNSSKYIITLHDLNFLYENENVDENLKKYQFNMMGLDYVVCISHFVEQDVVKHLKLGNTTKHTVIHNGVAKREDIDIFSPAELEQNLNGREYLFVISTFMRKKNIHLLVDMMRFLPDLCLVVAGKVIHHDYYEEVLSMIAKLGLKNRVFMLGKVCESEKNWLYDHCKAFVFPSQAEGFGIPPIEAMRSGKPVFASRNTSIPEVCGDMAFYWDVLEGEPMAKTLSQGLSNTDALQNNAKLLKAHSAQYNWERCADEYIKIYEQVAKL